MGIIAFSTRWAGSSLREAELRKLLEWGPGGFLIHEEVRTPDLERVLGFLPRRSVVALTLFSPLPRTLPPNEISPFRMGSLHPEERRDALQQGLRALEFADEAEIRWVIVPRAGLEEPPTEKCRALLAKETAPRIWEDLRRARTEAARRQLDSYLSTLSHLLEQADRYSVQLAISLGGLPSKLPDVPEAERILAEFSGAPLYLWPDTLADARYRRSAGPEAEKLPKELAPRVAGVTVVDGDRRSDHLPLGAGEVDLGHWTELRPPAAAPAVGGRAGPAAASPRRFWAIDLADGTSEEDFLATREKLAAFLRRPEADPFEPYLFKTR